MRVLREYNSKSTPYTNLRKSVFNFDSSKFIKMSCVFGNLVPVRREKEILYCFLEAKVKLFSNINEHRLSYAMTFLGINTLACTETEHLFLGRKLSSQFAPFKLPSEQNLVRLHKLLFLDFSEEESKMPPSHANIQFPFATNQRAEFPLPGMPLKPWHFQTGVEDKPRNETFKTSLDVTITAPMIIARGD